MHSPWPMRLLAWLEPEPEVEREQQVVRGRGTEPGDEKVSPERWECLWKGQAFTALHEKETPFSFGEGFDSMLETQIPLRQFNKEPKHEFEASCWYTSLCTVRRWGLLSHPYINPVSAIDCAGAAPEVRTGWSWFSGKIYSTPTSVWSHRTSSHQEDVCRAHTAQSIALQSHRFKGPSSLRLGN